MAIPEYLRKLLEWKRRLMADKARENERLTREYKARQQAKRDRIKALRRPPARVWRVGSTIFWEPPETVDQLEPAGYWIGEERHGAWTKHGDYLRPNVRSAQLFGDGAGAATVEAYYHDTALGEAYISPAVERPDEDPFLVNKVRYYVSVGGRPPIYYERWRRVLAGFGVAQPKRVRGKSVAPLAPAMTAREAQSYADRGWERWVPVAKALRRIESIRQ